VTIPKRIRESLGVTLKIKLRVYATGGKVTFEPVSPLDSLLDALETEAREKGYGREDMEREVAAVREALLKRLYGGGWRPLRSGKQDTMSAGWSLLATADNVHLTAAGSGQGCTYTRSTSGLANLQDR
jgi:bifunctional DNA-binding transcriptional regulator/antitoxin component of YhaV-PrlF toxin-antitoxin module